LQDVAARLPTYRPHLSDDQLRVLRELENDLRPFSKMLDEVGVERGFRPDIMDGGFYVPRGKALAEGLDNPLYIPPKIPVTRAGRGPEKAIRYDSAAAGIKDGREYAAIGEVLEDYATYVGQRSLELHVNNYLNALRNADGRLIGLTSSMLIDPALRSLRHGLKTRIRGKNKTLIAQNARSKEQERQALRDVRKDEQAGERVEATEKKIAEREDQFLKEDEIFARSELRAAIEDAQALALQHGQNIERLKMVNTRLRKDERQLVKDVSALSKAIIEGGQSIAKELAERRASTRAYAGGLKRTVGAHMTDAKQLTTKVDNLAPKVEKMSAKIDDLIERGDLLGDMRANSRAGVIEGSQNLRAIMHKKLGLAALQRELRILKMEHDRAGRYAEQSAKRFLNSQLNESDTLGLITSYQKEFDSLSSTWDAMVSKARQGPPEGYAYINLAGMERRSFPGAMAAAINKVVRDEGAPAGKFAGFIRPAVAANHLIQGLETTLDMSAIGIQGLVGMADNPKAWAEAVKLSFRAWGKDGERVLGRFLSQFDQTARDTGRVTSGTWAGSYNLHIGGTAIGELQVSMEGLTAVLGRVPGIRQANRAFGFFGDTLRLEWADDMLRNELRMGKTLEQLRRNGDLDRIAEIVNNMTGFSHGRAGGDLGELLLFAPRFLQSRLTTVSRAATGLRPGASLDQRIARRSMLKMIGGAVMLTHLINWAQGNETDMRPWVRGNPNSNFMRVRFGKRDFSLLGTWDSLGKALMLTAMGRPQDVLRTLSSPMVRIGWDIFSGKTVMEERTRGEGMQGLWSEETGYYALKTLSPFAAQEIPEVIRATSKGEYLAAGVTLTGEIFGMKSGPLGYTDQFRRVHRKLYPDVADKDLTALMKRNINADPEVQKEIAEIEEKRGPIDIRQRISIGFDDLARIKKRGEASLRENIDKGMDGPDLRIAIKVFKKTRFDQTQGILGNQELQEELRKKAADKPTSDFLAEAYWTADAPENPQTGEVDFDKRDFERDIILEQADRMKQWFPEVENSSYITGIGAPLDPVTGDPQSYRGRRYEDPVVFDMIKRFEDDYAVMQPYLQASRDLAEERGLLDVYKAWRASNDPNFLKAHPVFKAVMDTVETKKDNMRKNDINLERKLYKWGYIDVAMNALLHGEIMLLRRRQGGEVTQRLDIEPEPELAVVP